MIVTAVDWSGDSGAESEGPGRPGFISFAFISIDEHEIAALGESLSSVRNQCGFHQGHVFKHLKSTEAVRACFFQAIQQVDLRVHVLLIDKSVEWPVSYWKLRGNERLAICLADGASRLPSSAVHRQTLLLDLDQKKDGKFATQIIKSVHRSTRGPGHSGFRKIRCAPDTDVTFGNLVQVADMVAGAVRRSETLAPSDLPQLARMVRRL